MRGFPARVLGFPARVRGFDTRVLGFEARWRAEAVGVRALLARASARKP
jgi:hypothetical protein